MQVLRALQVFCHMVWFSCVNYPWNFFMFTCHPLVRTSFMVVYHIMYNKPLFIAQDKTVHIIFLASCFRSYRNFGSSLISISTYCSSSTTSSAWPSLLLLWKPLKVSTTLSFSSRVIILPVQIAYKLKEKIFLVPWRFTMNIIYWFFLHLSSYPCSVICLNHKYEDLTSFFLFRSDGIHPLLLD